MTKPKPRLCAAGAKLRSQTNLAFPKRDKTSDGWLGDARHAANESDHNPTALGMVRAIDIDADLDDRKGTSTYLAEQLRVIAKDDGRIAYLIHNGKIASSKKSWAWRNYDGINQHVHHIHISFTRLGDEDGAPFAVPMLERKKIV